MNKNTIGFVILAVWIIAMLALLVFKVKSAFAFIPILTVVAILYGIWWTFESLSAKPTADKTVQSDTKSNETVN